MVSRFEDLTEDKLGFVGSVREIGIGADGRITVFEDCLNSSVVTILIRGGNNLVIINQFDNFFKVIYFVTSEFL